MNIDMTTFWNIYGIVMVIYTVFLLPYLISFESQDFENTLLHKLVSSLCSYILFLAVLGSIIAAIYIFSGFVIPIPLEIRAQGFGVVARSEDEILDIEAFVQNYPQFV